MIKRYKYLFFLVLVAVVFTGCGGGGGSTPGVGSIVGYVRYSGSQTPVAGAYLEVVNNYGPQYGRTEQDGSFEITGIRAGTATLIIQHPGIKGGEHRQNLTVPSGGTNTLTVFVTPGSAETGGVIGWVYVPEKSQLMASSLQEVEPLLSSQATPPRGYEPLQGAEVSLGSQFATTNAQGRFFFTDLDPGFYTLSVTHKSLRFPIRKQVDVYRGTTTWLGDYGKEPLFGGIGYYVVIGVDKYPEDTDPLPGPRDDAIAVYDELFRKNKLAGLGRLLIRDGGSNTLAPTRENIQLSIEEAVRLAENITDYLVIYFSGRTGLDFLRPNNDIKGENWITDVELESWVSDFPGHVTLIVDGGESASMADGTPLQPQALQKMRYTVLASAMKGQSAWHDINLGDGKLSVFTHYLVEGIATKNADQKAPYGDITARELFEYVDHKMDEYDQTHHRPIQVPDFHEGYDGDTVIFRY